jgi:hypothetical protein
LASRRALVFMGWSLVSADRGGGVACIVGA